MQGLSKGLASNFVWASSMAVHWSAVVFTPPYFNIVSFEKTQTSTPDIGTLNPESCSDTELKMQTILPICWDFETVTTSLEAFNFKLISRTQKSYILIFFNQYIIIYCVLIFQAIHYNPGTNMALTLEFRVKHLFMNQ